jgi:glycosyltransferase involved in cell wall biosynthesis
MKIAAISSVLNEEFFIRNYIETNIKYVDEILLSDGGSVDNTITIIKEYIAKGFNIKLFYHHQGRPYSNEWAHDEILNNLKDNTSADYIIQLDSDELLIDEFRYFKTVANLFPNIILFGLPLITFWGDKNTVRINVENDMHWYPNPKFCLFKNIKEIKYINPNHALLTYDNKNIFDYNYKIVDIPMIHLHYLKAKINDNRSLDFGGDFNNPNWKLNKGIWTDNPFGYTGEYEIKTIEYNSILSKIGIKDIIKNIVIQMDKELNHKNNELEKWKECGLAYKQQYENIKNILENQ